VNKRFDLLARVSSSNPEGVRPVLGRIITKGSVREEGGEFVLRAEMEGTSAKELNRSLLSALRKVEKKTRLHAEWASDDGTTERFFDYVLKKKTKTTPST
jgi:hypothetical protein